MWQLVLLTLARPGVGQLGDSMMLKSDDASVYRLSLLAPTPWAIIEVHPLRSLKTDDETSPAASRSGRPHLLFMMADQMRSDRLGVVSPGVRTPALDSLALEGARFSRAYSATPTCTPARAAILTGLSPWRHG